MAAPPLEKRCLYEVLGVSRDCTADEIRSAYKRLALQRHPDKLVRSGVPESEATASFQELVNAYEVLSDARERAWYDSHRNQILFSSSSSSSSSRGSTTGFVPDLFSFFSNSVYSGYGDTGRGFYKVYGDVFEKIYTNELNFARKMGVPLPREAPVMGNLGSPYAQVTAFYNYWLGFVSVLDFFWADEYDAMAGPDRRSRRMMEEENKKLRKKAKREYNESVRGHAEFVKKRDKRVIDMQVKRNKEMEKKREEEKQKKKERERQKAEKARNYEEPEWAKVEEVDDYEDEDVVEEKKNELYCVACSKKFKSDKQWRNHEQSKKHKEKVAELREAFGEEDKEFEATTAHEREGEEEKEVDVNGANSADDEVNELQEKFESTVGVQEDVRDNGNTESSEENEFADVDNHSEGNGIAAELGSDDDEAILLEAMLSGRKNRNKRGNKSKAPAEKIQVEMTSDELEFMEYNDTKGSRRSRGGGRRRAGKQEEAEAQPKQAEVLDRNGEADKHERQDDDVAEPSSHTVPESETKRTDENPKQAVNKKNAKKKENAPKPVVTSRGRKQKGAASGSENTCEKCGAEFESRNKLHKHLGDTGHSSLKSR